MPPANQDRMGFWGQPTSTIEWCEFNYEVTPYIAEFWNTLTNLSMIVPPIYGIIDAIQRKYEIRFILCYVCLLCVGIGSSLFHMTLKYEMQLMDEIPMIFTSAVLIYNIIQVRCPGHKRNSFLKYLLVVYCLAFVFVYLVVQEPLILQVMYGVLVVVMLLLDIELVLYFKSKENINVFLIGITMYAVGFMLWNLDNQACDSLRSFRSKSSSNVLSTISQFHGWWHIFAGYATYIQILGIIFINGSMSKKGKPLKYNLGVMGIKLEDVETKEKSKENGHHID